LKKKKKIDPAIIRAREDRKKKKIEKQIKRLEKNSQQLKPIDELEVPPTVFDTLQYVIFYAVLVRWVLKDEFLGRGSEEELPQVTKKWRAEP